jgi:hypothetical protein
VDSDVSKELLGNVQSNSPKDLASHRRRPEQSVTAGTTSELAVMIVMVGDDVKRFHVLHNSATCLVLCVNVPQVAVFSTYQY